MCPPPGRLPICCLRIASLWSMAYPVMSSFVSPLNPLPEHRPFHSVFSQSSTFKTKQNEKDNHCIAAAVRLHGGGRFSDKYAHAYRNTLNGQVANSGYRERAVSAILGRNGHRHQGKDAPVSLYHRRQPHRPGLYAPPEPLKVHWHRQHGTECDV